jgi:hypothetical protein
MDLHDRGNAALERIQKNRANSLEYYISKRIVTDKTTNQDGCSDSRLLAIRGRNWGSEKKTAFVSMKPFLMPTMS